MLVQRGLPNRSTGLEMVDVVTGRWRHLFDFDGKDGRLSGCFCGAMAWPAGSQRIAFVHESKPGSPLVRAADLEETTTMNLARLQRIYSI